MNKTKRIVWTSLFAAFIFVSTFVIKIPVPLTNGYIHLGDGFVLLAGIFLGPIYGGVAAAIGSGLSDLIGGYSQWIIPTIIIKFFMGYVIGRYTHKEKKSTILLLSIVGMWIISIAFAYAYNKGIGNEFIYSKLNEIGIKNVDSKLLELYSGLKKLIIILPIYFISLIILNVKFKISNNVLNGISLSGMIMIIGYYIAGGIIYGNFILPLFSIYWNILQFIAGFILVSIFLSKFDKKLFLQKNDLYKKEKDKIEKEG